jgi:palmitoyltransferase
MICARYIFRCFKWLERLGDKVTGAAGPFFVGFAVILLSTGTICFCEFLLSGSAPSLCYTAQTYTVDVIQPTLSLPLLTTPICSLIALNLIMHYYYACTVPPGFAEDPPREAGHGILWSKKKDPAKDRILTGVQWSEGSVKITKATVTTCRKCGQLRPEVSALYERE